MFPISATHPNLSRAGYLPTLYAFMLLHAFYDATVFGEIANTQYESMVQEKGEKVRIRALPDIDVYDYVKGQNLVYQTPTPSFVDLDLDQGHYWALNANALDQLQSDIAYINQWATHASEKLKIKVDTNVLANIYSDAHADNKGATAGRIGSYDLGAVGSATLFDASTALNLIVNAGSVLDEQNIPETDRWIILPTWAINKLKLSELKDASLTGDRITPLRNGLIGMIDRFKVFRSNLLAGTTAETNAIFGHKVGLTFAAQSVNTETIDNPNDFGKLVRSKFIYGFKVTQPEAMGHLVIKIS